jgi:integrase
MAHLIKPWIVRYVDAEGRQVPKDTPGAVPVKERAKKYYAEGVPGWPKGKRVPLATLKATAQALLNKLVEDAIRGQAGIGDRYREHNARPLADHLQAYRRELEARGVSDKHSGQTCDRIRALAEGCEFHTLPEIDAESVVNWLTELRQDKTPPSLPADRDSFAPGEVAALLGVSSQALWLQARRAGVKAEGNGRKRRYSCQATETLLARAARGASVQTANFYLAAFKGFCRWLVADRRMAESPVARLRGGNPKLDRRHDRRELTAEELARILGATRGSAATFRGLAGEDRFHVYLTACGTGFRSHELAALRPDSFDFTGAVATVTLPATVGKNRRRATLPLPPGVAVALRAYFHGRQAGAPIWPGNWWKNGADMLRIDLEAAGVPYEVPGPDGPLFADFHSLRHSFITLMARSGVSPKQAQQLARHGDIRLTMDRYTHLGLSDLADAVGRLPALTAPAAAPETIIGVTEKEHDTLTALAAVGLALWGMLCGASHQWPRIPVAAQLQSGFAPPGDGLGPAGTDTDSGPERLAS